MAQIKMDAAQVAMHTTALKTAGSALTETAATVEKSGLSGMPAGKDFAALTHDVFAALQLYKQLVEKNGRHIDNMKNEFEKLDDSLSR